MKICTTHWDKIRDRIKLLGLDHLGAKSGEEATENLIDELQGGEPPYDPLMVCNNMIWSKGLEMAGLYLMGEGPPENDGQYCPICEAWKHRHDRFLSEKNIMNDKGIIIVEPGQEPIYNDIPEDQFVTEEMFESFWINGPTDAVLNECRNRGLVPNVS